MESGGGWIYLYKKHRFVFCGIGYFITAVISVNESMKKKMYDGRGRDQVGDVKSTIRHASYHVTI